jgi:hypothetical protein
LPSSGIVRAVRRREYPVKTPTSIVFFAFTNFKSMAISWPASGDVPKIALAGKENAPFENAFKKKNDDLKREKINDFKLRARKHHFKLTVVINYYLIWWFCHPLEEISWWSRHWFTC